MDRKPPPEVGDFVEVFASDSLTGLPQDRLLVFLSSNLVLIGRCENAINFEVQTFAFECLPFSCVQPYASGFGAHVYMKRQAMSHFVADQKMAGLGTNESGSFGIICNMGSSVCRKVPADRNTVLLPNQIRLQGNP